MNSLNILTLLIDWKHNRSFSRLWKILSFFDGSTKVFWNFSCLLSLKEFAQRNLYEFLSITLRRTFESSAKVERLKLKKRVVRFKMVLFLARHPLDNQEL
jgi:hypothetical protein